MPGTGFYGVDNRGIFRQVRHKPDGLSTPKFDKPRRTNSPSPTARDRIETETIVKQANEIRKRHSSSSLTPSSDPKGPKFSSQHSLNLLG
jgi:hypothetical protein